MAGMAPPLMLMLPMTRSSFEAYGAELGTLAVRIAKLSSPAAKAVGEVKVTTARPGVEVLMFTDEPAGAAVPRLTPVMERRLGL